MNNSIRQEPSTVPDFVYKKSNNTNIRDHVHEYLIECLERIGMGFSELNKNVIDDLASDIISDIYHMMFDDEIEKIQEITRKRGSYSYNKTNAYNMNILLSHMKIKIYVGLAARIARENYDICEAYDDFEDFKRINKTFVDQGIYRIETYKLIRGFTINDYLKLDNEYSGFFKNEDERREAIEYYNGKVHRLVGDLIKYICRVYYENWINRMRVSDPDYEFEEEDVILYPNDNNIGNFVVAYGDVEWYKHKDMSTRITSIDTDQWSTTSLHLMIHNVSIQILGRLYSRDLYPDDQSITGLIEYREKMPLFDRIQQFKQQFYGSIQKEHWFNEKDLTENYSFWDSGVQYDKSIMSQYISELERLKIEPHKTDAKFIKGKV